VSDWQLDNPEWVKQRKKDWREYKFNISNASMRGWLNVEKEHHKAVEQYFLTGCKKALECLYNYFKDSLLLELWIHPSQDVTTLQQVFERHIAEKTKIPRYSEAQIYWQGDRNYLKGMCFYHKNIKFKGVTRLNGRDTLMDNVFLPQTMADELAITPETQHAETINRHFLGLCTSFEYFFTRQEHLEYDICQYKMTFWKQAMMLCAEEEFQSRTFEWMLEELDKVALHSENYQPCQLKLAQDIEAVLADPTIPLALQERVATLRTAN